MPHTQFYPLSQRGVSADVRVILAQLLEAAQTIPQNTVTPQKPADMLVCFDMGFLSECCRQVFAYVNTAGSELENCSKAEAVETLYQSIELLQQKGWSTTSAKVLFSRVGIQLPAQFSPSQKDVVNADIATNANDLPEMQQGPRFVM